MTRELSEILVDLRKSRGLTQVELGKKLGVTNKTISKWEHGVFLPDITYLIDIADFYNISVDELLRGTAFETKTFKEIEKNEKNEKTYKYALSFGILYLFIIVVFLLILDVQLLKFDLTILIVNLICVITGLGFPITVIILRKIKELKLKNRK